MVAKVVFMVALLVRAWYYNGYSLNLWKDHVAEMVDDVSMQVLLRSCLSYLLHFRLTALEHVANYLDTAVLSLRSPYLIFHFK